MDRRTFLQLAGAATLGGRAFGARPSGKGAIKLEDVNTTDLRGAIELGCNPIESVFNPDDRNSSYWGADARPTAEFGPYHFRNTDGHMPGRHLNALLAAEGEVGVKINPRSVANLTRSALFSFGGPVTLPLDRNRQDGPLGNFWLHNLREGFHALHALARYRDSAKARELMEAAIDVVLDYWHPDRGWDKQRFETKYKIDYIDIDFIRGPARAIGPLVKYYRLTGYGPALTLAIALKNKALAECFMEDGSFAWTKMEGHVHSITSTMSSLAQLADVTRDAQTLDRVKTFYENGLKRMRDPVGWSPETLLPDKQRRNGPDRGEGNNAGDILETALVLAGWGHTEYYHDAERILRGHLLPSQLRDISWIKSQPNPRGMDRLRDVGRRMRGAWGFAAPYGHQTIGCPSVSFAMDIVGGVLASLCEAYRQATRWDGHAHRVNLLFDHETSFVKVESPYTHDALRITPKRSAPLFVRIPPWVDRRKMKISGIDANPRPTNGYLYFARAKKDAPVTLAFELPVSDLVLKHRDYDIRVRLRGDEPLMMDNFGADLTYFPPYAD